MTSNVDDELEEVFESMPFLNTLGIEEARIDDGSVTFRASMTDELTNHTEDIVHGGVAATLVDASVAAGTYSASGATPDEMNPLTICNGTNYFAPVFTGDELVVECEMVHVGRSVAYGESQVYRDGDLVASGSATYFQKWK